jgi:hypothetical protein
MSVSDITALNNLPVVLPHRGSGYREQHDGESDGPVNPPIKMQWGGRPVHSFQTLLADLGTLARDTIVTAITPDHELTVFTRPTPIQPGPSS